MIRQMMPAVFIAVGSVLFGLGAGWLLHREAMRHGEVLTAAELESHIKPHIHKSPPYRMVPIPTWVPDGSLIGEVRGADGTVWYSVLDGGHP